MVSHGKIAAKYLHRTRFFSSSRKPGKFSPKSGLIFIKAGPKFSTLTPQQKRVSEAGKSCATEMRGKPLKERRVAAGKCIRAFFGKK